MATDNWQRINAIASRLAGFVVLICLYVVLDTREVPCIMTVETAHGLTCGYNFNTPFCCSADLVWRSEHYCTLGFFCCFWRCNLVRENYPRYRQHNTVISSRPPAGLQLVSNGHNVVLRRFGVTVLTLVYSYWDKQWTNEFDSNIISDFHIADHIERVFVCYT